MLLKTKLFIFGLLCAAIPILLCTYWSAKIASDSLESELHGKSREVLAQVNALTRNKVVSLFSYSFLALTNPALPSAVQHRDWKLLAHTANTIQSGLRLDILEIIDDKGILVYNAEEPLKVGGDRFAVPFVRGLFEDRRSKPDVSAIGIENRPRGVAVEIATILPKTTAVSSLPGAMLMGFYLDDLFFAEFKKVIHADFCLFRNQEIIASTFEEPKEQVSVSLRDYFRGQGRTPVDADPVRIGKARLNRTHYLFAVKPLIVRISGKEPAAEPVEDFQLAVFLSTEKARQAERQAIFYIAAAGMAGIAIALFLALIFSRQILAPIKIFTHAVDEIGQGNLNHRVHLTSKDEIGFLAYTFNTMMDRLKGMQEKLIRTERLAAIGQLASGVGHELRNPLAAIKNAIYFIRSSFKKNPPPKDYDQIQQMMELAEGEIEATVKITNDLLEFSRVIRVSLRRLNLNELLAVVFQVVSVPPAVRVVKKLQQDLPAVHADPERMKQVFVNLISNAVEAMPEGGTLEVETCYNENSIEAYVRDTGSGISEEFRGKIFEPLFSTKARGTGLGLSIVKGIVETHRGELTFKTEEGRGTEFLVRLPILSDQ